MPSSFTSLHVHLIFSTKHRRPIITEDIRERLYPYVAGIVRKLDGEVLAIGGMPDHLHLLVRLHPQISVAVAVRTIKSNSSKWIHERFADARMFAWQTGYAAFAVSASNIEAGNSRGLRPWL